VPNVDSILVEFRAHDEPLGDDALRRRLFELVDAAFGQRRKMLRQALAPSFGGSAQEASAALERVGLEPTARGEQLTADDFLRLAREAS
jgi:16S rRNA (adenine1518-N6/adenine1519-N6)-dimethyltransferase